MPKSKKVKEKIKTHKLYKVCQNLGLNLLDVSKYIKIDSLPDVACWGIDKNSGEQFIYINPKTLKLGLPLIEQVLRHEILHAAGYKSIGGARCHELLNIVLDVAINYTLWKANSKRMTRLSQKIYPEESVKTPIALAQCHLMEYIKASSSKDSGRKMFEDDDIWNLYKDIWSSPEIPSPTSLYYQIIMETSVDILVNIGELNPFGEKEDGEKILRGTPKPKNEQEKKKQQEQEKESKFSKLAKKIAKNVRREMEESHWRDRSPKSWQEKQDNYERLGKSFSSLESDLFEDIDVKKKSLQTRAVQDFLNSFNIKQQLDETTNKIITSLGGKTALQPFPMKLTKKSIIYIAAGITKYFPFYWNQIPDSRKPRLGVYIDTSPSMEEFKEHEVYLIDQLKEWFPTRIFLFAGSVTEVDLTDFASGKYKGGYSTSFDAIITHFLENDFEACIVITDGESGVQDENKKKFVESRKRLFPVYFSSSKMEKITSSLDEIAEQKMQINIDKEEE